MEIRFECLRYLTNHNFIRNSAVENFVLENNFAIEIAKHIIYCVGIIDGQRIVHVIKIIGQNNAPGVTSYLIEWFNVACTPLDEFDLSTIDSVTFWVHSGVALRKNFFLYEDRMSLLKSSFIYDSKRNSYYRLVNLSEYIVPNVHLNIQCPIYSSVSKISFPVKRTKKLATVIVDKRLSQLQKSVRKTMKSCNSFRYLEKNYPRLFEEMSKIINL